MKAAIHALKYDRLQPAARGLGRMLAQASLNWPAKRPLRCLWFPCRCTGQSMPSEASTRLVRWLFMRLRRSERRMPEWRLTLASKTLMRLRATESQAGLTPRQRRLNVRGAFTVSDPAAVTLKHVFGHRRHLHDRLDCPRPRLSALTRAGAASVWVATLARASRVHDNRRNVSFRLDDAEDDLTPAGKSPVATLQGAGIYSLHGKSSF